MDFGAAWASILAPVIALVVLVSLIAQVTLIYADCYRRKSCEQISTLVTPVALDTLIAPGQADYARCTSH